VITRPTGLSNFYNSNLFFGLEAALLASDDLGLAFGGLVCGRRCRAETSIGVKCLDVATQSTLGARRVVTERTSMIEVKAHMSVELHLGLACSVSKQQYNYWYH